MFEKLFGKKKAEPVFMVAQLNARIGPADREALFGDPLDEALQKAGLGEVSGGGTLQSKEGEIEYCGCEGGGEVVSHWQGPRETALHLYGRSFEAMQARLAAFLSRYPLCQRCRVVQIA